MTRRKQATALMMSIGAAVGLIVTYLRGGQPQWEGALLGLALGGIGWALIVAAHDVLSTTTSEEREPLGSPPEDVEAVAADLEGSFTRRSFLAAMFLGALGALAVAVGFPIRSLGQRPGRALHETAWEPGKRLVDNEGRAVTIDTMGPGSAMTVFPQGSEEAADSIVILLRVDPERLELPSGRESWAPEGHIAYSKICTHAGCPVGLFDTDTGYLICPCHQSSFDALRGAVPLFGPAARPLAQLPLAVDESGYLVSTGEMSHPVGPGFFDLPQEGEDK